VINYDWETKIVDGMHAVICQTKLPVISFNLFNLKNMDISKRGYLFQ
jgi:hypothetical protein